MVADFPEEAIDAYLGRIRATLSCVSSATAIVSPNVPDQSRSVTLQATGLFEPGRILLSTHGGLGELIFRFAHAFTIEPISQVGRVQFEVWNSFYQYRILDFEENELIIYDWHPYGASLVTSPHLHVSAAGSIILQQRAGSQLTNRKTHLGSFHLPTSKFVDDDIVELLIREFLVDPLRVDWEAVLRANRKEHRQGRYSLE